VVRLFYSITLVAISCVLLSGCNSEDSETPTSQNNSTGTAGQSGTNGRNGTDGADCFDAPGTTDRNSDGQLGVADCIGPTGPQGPQGPQGMQGAMGLPGPAGDSGNTFKLLAKGQNHTRVAEHTFLPGNGAVQTWLNNTTAYNSLDQHIDIIQSAWPSVEPTEIILVAKNHQQVFCAGGSSTNNGNTPADFNRVAGTTSLSYCTDSRMRPGTSGEPVAVNGGHSGARNFWIRLKINGNAMMECLSQTDQNRDIGTSSGMTGVSGYWGTTCHYVKGAAGAADWYGNLTSITVQEVSRTAVSSWEWEIYYR